MRQRVVDDGDHALVLAVAGQCVEPRAVDRVDRDICRFGPRNQVADPSVLPARRDIEIVHRVRALAQARGDGVEAEQGAGGGHRMDSGRADRGHGSPETLC